MKVKKFQIFDYKSIKHFEPCWLASDVTILAGKNESGKTAALEALRDFDSRVKEFPPSAHPLDEDAEDLPAVKIWFDINISELKEIARENGIELDDHCYAYIEKNGFPLSKDSEGDYFVGKEITDFLIASTQTIRSDIIKEINILIEYIRKSDVKFHPLSRSVKETTLFYWIKQLEKIAPPEVQKTLSDEIQSLITQIKEKRRELLKVTNTSELSTALVEYLPKFVFFSGFGDVVLPYEVPLAEVEKYPSVMDFLKVANIDIERVRETSDIQRRANLLKNKSAQISGDFADYWHQDAIRLGARIDGDKLVINILEGNKTIEFKPEQRSKGFQWFLSFYLKLRAENVLSEMIVILLDEPDQHLHAKAQEDVLGVLETLSEEAQIIFSTHSPYFLNPSRFDRIKLVTKDLKGNEGTILWNKITTLADESTLRPIITALGVDITKDTSLIRSRNIIVEGMSDYYILLAMSEYLGLDFHTKASFIPAIGAKKIAFYASTFIGWAVDFVTVLDNDREGQNAAKELKEKLFLDDKKIIKIDGEDCTTEDLFSSADFNKYILEDADRASDKKNSKLLSATTDKVIHAKIFFDKIKSKKNIELSEETQNNFSALFEQIERGFKHSTLKTKSQQSE